MATIVTTVTVGDYTYTLYNDYTASIEVVDTTKEIYSEIVTPYTYNGNDYVVKYMNSCFAYCINMKVAPVIPSTVTEFESCFAGCESLTGNIYMLPIDASQPVGIDAYHCFYNTIEPIVLYNPKTGIADTLAETANNGNVYVNTAPSSLPTSSGAEFTEMNYKENTKFITLSPQTNAELISVQVPHGNSTITTTLNDALVDLYYRAGLDIGGGA